MPLTHPWSVHQKVFEAYCRLSGNVLATQRETGISYDTITKWRDNEGWEELRTVEFIPKKLIDKRRTIELRRN